MKSIIFFFLLLSSFFLCKSQPISGKIDENLLESLMKGQPGQFQFILDNRDTLRVQVIYTQIDRKKNNRPVFTDHYFNVNRGQYYYPASTVKLPVSLLALERLQSLRKKGINRNTSMVTEAIFGKQTPVYNDPTSLDGRPTIEHYIKKILLVSDNDAFNRLYEFLGQQYVNKSCMRKDILMLQFFTGFKSL